MRSLRGLLILLLLPVSFSALSDDDDVLLKTIDIQGNNVTKEDYIRSRITLSEGRLYDIDELMDQINKSRRNLEQTDLFSNIFFDDRFEDENTLYLTLRVREKNYWFFGPYGGLGFEDDFYCASGVYLNDTNVFGRGHGFMLASPLYRDRGLVYNQQGDVNRWRYEAGLEYIERYYREEDRFSVQAGGGYRLHGRIYGGAGIVFSKTDGHTSGDSVSSLAVFPTVSGDSKGRKEKTWHYISVSPMYGYVLNGRTGERTFYGMEAEASYYRDLFFKIFYRVEFRGGMVSSHAPPFHLQAPSVRGTYFGIQPGPYALTLINELHIPLPTNMKFVFVPFLDTGLQKENDGPGFLGGGGIGLHVYTRFQDPLIFDLGFGRGFMIKFKGGF